MYSSKPFSFSPEKLPSLKNLIIFKRQQNLKKMKLAILSMAIAGTSALAPSTMKESSMTLTSTEESTVESFATPVAEVTEPAVDPINGWIPTELEPSLLDGIQNCKSLEITNLIDKETHTGTISSSEKVKPFGISTSHFILSIIIMVAITYVICEKMGYTKLPFFKS